MNNFVEIDANVIVMHNNVIVWKSWEDDTEMPINILKHNCYMTIVFEEEINESVLLIEY